jgi:hypothetical protein
MKDSWQARIFLRLRDRGWYRIGDLFESIETEIPLHLAMRNAMNNARGLGELPDGTTARWRKFLSVLSAIGVETSGNRYNFKWGDVVRLRHVEGCVCDDCGGPVIKASWASGRYVAGRPPQVACLACEAAAAAPAPAVVEKAPLPAVIIRPPPPPAADLIGEAVAYAVLHRLMAHWGPPMSHRAPAPWRKGGQPGEARAPPPVTFFWPVQRNP